MKKISLAAKPKPLLGRGTLGAAAPAAARANVGTLFGLDDDDEQGAEATGTVDPRMRQRKVAKAAPRPS